LREAKSSLEAAQQRQKHYADKKRREADFCIGNEVLLNSKNVKIRKPGTPKLMPKWIGPLKVIEKINPVAYRLELPPNLRIHNVFHVSLMQKYRKDGRIQPPPLSFWVDEQEYFHVEQIVSHRVRMVTTKRASKHVSKQQKPVMEYLIKWEGYSDDHNTWEPEEILTEDTLTEQLLCEYKNWRLS